MKRIACFLFAASLLAAFGSPVDAGPLRDDCGELIQACALEPQLIVPAAPTKSIDRESFWSAIKSMVQRREKFEHDGVKYYLGRPLLSESAKQGTEAIVDEWERLGGSDNRQLAYLLGTVYRETVSRMTPVREAFCDSTDCVVAALNKYMLKHPDRVKSNYAIANSCGRSYYGRGYSQLTGHQRYKCTGENLGWGDQLVKDPDLALEPARAAAILVQGARRGLFKRGQTLDRYFTATDADWINARKVVNPGSMDHAPITAGYAKLFFKAMGSSDSP